MHRIELLWFEGCPNHLAARTMVDEVLAHLGIEATVKAIEVPDEEIGNQVRFPGSPTIRVNGVDIEPGFFDCENCTPRCRVYPTPAGLRGFPEQQWLVSALSAGESTQGTASP
jgi:hypothetical protein